MKSATDIGMNRTGIGVSPVHSAELIEGALAGLPSSMGDESGLATVRLSYEQESEPIGTVAPPSTMKGAAKAVLELVKGNKMGVLLDKLAERLAFERTGARLYEALITKLSAEGSWPGGPDFQSLKAIHDDELRHFEMLRQTIVELGGDPTVQTPSADVTGVEGMGLVQVITDPRTSLAHGVHSILIAELTDNDGYSLLIQLTESLGQTEIAERFRAVRIAEERHLERVRLWLTNHVIADGAKQLEEVSA